MSDPIDEFLGGEGGEGDGGTDNSDPKGASSPANGGDPSKRISDLQSRADKETARANKAEAELAKLRAAVAGGGSGAAPAAPVAGAPGNAEAFVLDIARDTEFGRYPLLAEAGYTAADLTGNTPAEIRRSAKALSDRFEGFRAKERDRVLAERGLAPDVPNANPGQARDFSAMPSDEFKKFVEAVMQGRAA